MLIFIGHIKININLFKYTRSMLTITVKYNVHLNAA